MILQFTNNVVFLELQKQSSNTIMLEVIENIPLKIFEQKTAKNFTSQNANKNGRELRK